MTTFAKAIEYLKGGHFVARHSWEPEYGYLKFVFEDHDTGAQAHIIRVSPNSIEEPWPQSHLISFPVHFTADVILAHDWYIVGGDSDGQE